MRSSVLAASIAMFLIGTFWFVARQNSHDPFATQRIACAFREIPIGQATHSTEPEPLTPAWCYTLLEPIMTRVETANGWSDEFNTKVSMSRLDDRDMGYRIFTVENSSSTREARMFVNNDHWMVDTASGFEGGVMLRPDRTFYFENGALIIEADVAAGIDAYKDSAAVEIDVSSAPSPTEKNTDRKYGYGSFGGYDTFGCRFQADRVMTCSLFNAAGKAGDANVFGNELGRTWQALPFQSVGTVSLGGDAGDGREKYFRRCEGDVMDMICRDRFRIELRHDSFTVYVNGQKYFSQERIPVQYQLPPSFTRGGVFVYFTSWTNRPTAESYRFHWDRIAINPRDSLGAVLAPSAAPSFQHAM